MGILDYITGQSKREAEQALSDIEARYAGINIPDIEAQKLALQQLIYGGDIGSAYRGITEDPTLRAAQMGALQKYQDITAQGGLTAEDRARLAMINQQAAQQEQAQRQAIMANMQARGMGGSGAELAAQLAAQQGGAQTRAMGGWDTARAAEQRALQAIASQAQLGGQIRGQDYGIASNRASALDAINRFNQMNRMNTQMTNVDIANRQQMANKGLYQQQFQNRLALAQPQTQADIMRMQQAQQSGAQGRQDVGNILTGAGKTMVGGHMMGWW